ncbi:MAG: restriction endonuclease subunit S [Bacteroidales bacterium]|nr:restriction endonuclease subunit S [Bacteroidales bacterium]
MREGWEIKTLEDLFDIGSSKRVYESQWRNAGVPFYRAREIVKLSRDGFVDNELFIDEELYKEYANNYGTPKCGDIMVTGVGTLGVCYIVKKNDKFYFKDGNILWFKSKEGTNPFYVNYAFKSNYLRQQIDNCNGATVGTFTIVRAKKTTIPVPPLAEQERIVEELDLLSSIIEKKKAQLKELDQLAQSIFYDMFGDPITNEKGFPLLTINDVIKFEGGSQPPKTAFEYIPSPDNIRLIQIRDYKTDEYITYVPKSLARRFCEEDDIMIGRYGPPIFQILKGIKGAYNVALMKAVPLKGNKEFIRAFLQQKCLLRFLENFSRRVAGQDGIQMDKLKSYPFPYPPIELQSLFASKVEAIERQKSLIQQSIVETQTLFDSRMDYWFD